MKFLSESYFQETHQIESQYQSILSKLTQI